ncbi:MAG: protein kinase [Phycisphaerae bacterium]|jgi:serine/threonine protein kinase/tetratricopeptide (TPR) repeat protein|nr:protein kinase [Phycisphaerae bacterium]
MAGDGREPDPPSAPKAPHSGKAAVRSGSQANEPDPLTVQRPASDLDVTSAEVESLVPPHASGRFIETDVFPGSGHPASSASGSSSGFSGSGCPDRESLELVAVGATNVGGVMEHLDRCPVCREVVRRLRADNELLNDFVSANRDRFDVDRAKVRSERPMDVVPGFRVEGEIHRGAQGVVYRAQQVSTRRNVALKTLLQGKFATSRQRARFDREVEVVASLRHPHIVTLFESGRTSDGLAFFAMELVNGRPLSDILKLPEGVHDKPPVLQLLATYLQIVKAIAYAHQRGVIHRDLKPANILIDDGLEPHVLDFGLARSARGEEKDQDMIEATAAGEFLGTFAYAAPEQLRGNPDLIDVRTDVFALGVILYEILAGERPYKPPGGSFSIADLLLARLENDPQPPSSVRSPIDPDLDVIALTCLKSKPEERYQSAQALAEDLERFLDGRPILARRDSKLYVARKWVRRHWLATSVTLAIVGLIVGGSARMAVLGERARREGERANRTLNAFRETFQSINPEIGRGRKEMSVLQFLALLRERAVSDAPTDPVVAATLINTVEASWLGFEGNRTPLERLEESLRLCRDAAERVGQSETRQVAEAIHNLARGHLLKSEFGEAERLYREALDVWDRVDGRDSATSAMTLQHLASCRRSQGDLDEADALLQRAYRVQKDAHGEPSWEVAAVINGQASVLRARGKFTEALDRFEEALAMIKLVAKPDDFRIGRAHGSVGNLKRMMKRPGALEDLTIAERVIVGAKGAESTEAIEARSDLAAVQLEAGDAASALQTIDMAIAAFAGLGEAAPRRCESYETRGHALIAIGRADEAVDAFRLAIGAASGTRANETASRCAEALREAGLVQEATRLTPP